MAVISIVELFEGRSGSDDSKQQVSLTRSFLAQTNSNADDVPTVISDAGIPAMFSVHPSYANAFVTGRSATQAEDPKVWKITISYSSNTDTVSPSSTPSAPQTKEVASQQQGSAPAERVAAPLGRPTDVDFSTSAVPYILYTDYHPTPKSVVNAAKEKFDPPIEGERATISMRVEFNSAAFAVTTWWDRVKTVNIATFATIYTARKLLLNSVSAKRVYENGVKYWRISLEVLINRQTWDLEVLNHSYSEILANGKKVTAVDGMGKPLPHGVILNEAGARLAAGVDPTIANGGLINFYKYEPADWSWFTPIYDAIL